MEKFLSVIILKFIPQALPVAESSSFNKGSKSTSNTFIVLDNVAYETVASHLLSSPSITFLIAYTSVSRLTIPLTLQSSKDTGP